MPSYSGGSMVGGSTLSWMKDPRGFLKILILITDLLALAFFVEGVGFMKVPEFRLYFMITGGFVLILLFRLFTYTFEGKLTSGPQEVMADIVGALLLTSLAVLLVFRGLHHLEILMMPGHKQVDLVAVVNENYTKTYMRPATTEIPDEVKQNWFLIFVAAVCGFLAGITLAIDACFVLRLPD